MKRMPNFIAIGILLAVVVGLCLIFPRAFAFVELAAREFLYLWWLALLVAFGIWLAWGLGRGGGKDREDK